MAIQVTFILLTQVLLLFSYDDGFLFRNDSSSRYRQRKYVDTSCILHAKKVVPSDTGSSSNDVTATPRSVAVFALMNSLTKKNPVFATRQLENDKHFLNFSSRDRAFSKLLLTTVGKLLSPRKRIKSHLSI